MPISNKKGLIYTLLRLAFVLCCDWNKFHAKVCFLKNTLRKHLFPGHFMDRCIMSFLDKIFIVKDVAVTVPKKRS